MTRSNAGPAVALDENLYACDLVLHDRFLNFSAEILKLSLAGIGGVGFFVTLLAGNRSSRLQDALATREFQIALELSVVFFALAASLSMVHRFYSSDGMWHHMRLLRSLKALGETADVAEDKAKRRIKLKLSEKCLKLSALALVLGAASLGVAFLSVLPSL